MVKVWIWLGATYVDFTLFTLLKLRLDLSGTNSRHVWGRNRELCGEMRRVRESMLSCLCFVVGGDGGGAKLQIAREASACEQLSWDTNDDTCGHGAVAHTSTVQWRTHLATVQWRTHPPRHTVQWRTFWVGCLEASNVICNEPAHTGSPEHACFRFERCRVEQCCASRDAGALGPHVPSGWVPLPS